MVISEFVIHSDIHRNPQLLSPDTPAILFGFDNELELIVVPTLVDITGNSNSLHFLIIHIFLIGLKNRFFVVNVELSTMQTS